MHDRVLIVVAEGRGRRPIVALVLVVATVLFAWGALAERASVRVEHHVAHAIVAPSGGSSSTHAEGSDVHGAGGAETGAGGVETGAAHAETATEHRRVLGINLESLWLILTGVVVSIALALALVMRRERYWITIAFVICAAFFVLEIAEVQHQHQEARTGLMVLAGTAAFAHLAAALFAASEFGARSSP